MVGSPIENSSIGTANSNGILDGGLLEAENIVSSLTVPSSVNKILACKKLSLLGTPGRNLPFKLCRQTINPYF